MKRFLLRALIAFGLVAMIVGALIVSDNFYLGLGNVCGGGFITSVGWILLE